MTGRLSSSFVYDLMEVADGLSVTRGRANLEQAAFRRAVSTVYYALFHAICYVCAAELVGWSKTEKLEPIYRSVEHGIARKRLMSSEAQAIDPAIASVGNVFKLLQEQRYEADYKPPEALFKRKNVQAFIAEGRKAVSLLESLDRNSRLQLAVLLIARPRSA